MANLAKRIAAWQKANLITEEQAKAILEHEESGGSNRYILAVLGIGVFAIALGVVALIASNWRDIPDFLKLSGFFLLWGGVGAGAWYGNNAEKILVREVCATLFALLMFAGIGLIAQIFNLSGTPWRPLAFWSVTMLPLALTSRSRFLPAAWMLVSTGAVILFAAKPNSQLLDLTNAQGVLVGAAFGLWSLALPFADNNSWATAEVRASWRHLALSLLTIGAALLGQFTWMTSHKIESASVAALLVAGGFFAFSTLLITQTKKPSWRSECLLAGVAAAICLLCAIKGNASSKLFAIVLFMLPFAAAAYHAAKENDLRMFRSLTGIIGLRLLIAYFEIFGSLATTGFGLIISGLLLMGGVVVWRNVVRHLITTRK